MSQVRLSCCRHGRRFARIEKEATNPAHGKASFGTPRVSTLAKPLVAYTSWKHVFYLKNCLVQIDLRSDYERQQNVLLREGLLSQVAFRKYLRMGSSLVPQVLTLLLARRCHSLQRNHIFRASVEVSRSVECRMKRFQGKALKCSNKD